MLTALLVLALSGTVTGLAATDRLPGQQRASVTPTPTPSTTPRAPAPAVLAAPSPAPTSASVPVRVARLRALLADPALGGDPSALVLDATTGATLLDRGATVAHTPASVAKLATTAAALVAIGPQVRFTTRTVTGVGPDQVVLVGGGDPTLALRSDRRSAYPRRATLTELADATAAALRRRTPTTAAVTVRVDDSLYAGPAVSPAWPAGYVPSGVVSPVSALSVDQVACGPGPTPASPILRSPPAATWPAS